MNILRISISARLRKHFACDKFFTILYSLRNFFKLFSNRDRVRMRIEELDNHLASDEQYLLDLFFERIFLMGLHEYSLRVFDRKYRDEVLKNVGKQP